MAEENPDECMALIRRQNDDRTRSKARSCCSRLVIIALDVCLLLFTVANLDISTEITTETSSLILIMVTALVEIIWSSLTESSYIVWFLDVVVSSIEFASLIIILIFSNFMDTFETKIASYIVAYAVVAIIFDVVLLLLDPFTTGNPLPENVYICQVVLAWITTILSSASSLNFFLFDLPPWYLTLSVVFGFISHFLAVGAHLSRTSQDRKMLTWCTDTIYLALDVVAVTLVITANFAISIIVSRDSIRDQNDLDTVFQVALASNVITLVFLNFAVVRSKFF